MPHPPSLTTLKANSLSLPDSPTIAGKVRGRSNSLRVGDDILLRRSNSLRQGWSYGIAEEASGLRCGPNELGISMEKGAVSRRKSSLDELGINHFNTHTRGISNTTPIKIAFNTNIGLKVSPPDEVFDQNGRLARKNSLRGLTSSPSLSHKRIDSIGFDNEPCSNYLKGGHSLQRIDCSFNTADLLRDSSAINEASLENSNLVDSNISQRNLLSPPIADGKCTSSQNLSVRDLTFAERIGIRESNLLSPHTDIGCSLNNIKSCIGQSVMDGTIENDLCDGRLMPSSFSRSEQNISDSNLGCSRINIDMKSDCLSSRQCILGANNQSGSNQRTQDNMPAQDARSLKGTIV